MKANIDTRLHLKRKDISDIAPLRTPYVVMIDPSSICNNRCVFCPTGSETAIKKSNRYQGFMHFDLFKSIIDGFADFTENVKVLRLYKEGEPLLNPAFCDFVSYAKISGKIDRIDTTTNGLLLDKDLANKIIESGIDQINISINAVNSERHLSLTKNSLDLKILIKNIAYLYEIKGSCIIYIKGIDEHLTDDEKLIFMNLFGNISDNIFFEHLQPNWPNFSFSHIDVDYTVGHYGQPLLDKEVCPYIFYLMVINSDGTVSACVQDWEHRLILGDLRAEKISRVWLGKNLNELQKKHLTLKRCEVDVCKDCPVLRHGTLDNIDNSRLKILRKFEFLSE